jgi:hypothetical protein
LDKIQEYRRNRLQHIKRNPWNRLLTDQQAVETRGYH